jgi:hypothetical protein
MLIFFLGVKEVRKLMSKQINVSSELSFHSDSQYSLMSKINKV